MNNTGMRISLFIKCLSAFIAASTGVISAQTVTVNDATVCMGHCATLVATGAGGTFPYTYLWSNGETASTISVCPSTSTNYTVTLSDASGGLATTTALVTVKPPLNIAAPSIMLKCFGDTNGIATVTPVNGGSPPFIYIWNTGQTTPSISGLGAGTYKVTVTESKGCSAAATVMVSQPSAISANVIPAAATCGASNGSAIVSSTGGTGTHNYFWSNGVTGNVASGLSAGFYIVTVKDVNACSKVLITLIPNAGSGTASAFRLSNVSCFGGNNGSAKVNMSGGITPYSYSWSNGATTQVASGLPAGTYYVIVRDAASCLTGSIVNITQPPPLKVTLTVNQPICGSANGNASANATGGTGSYNYSWSNGATSKTISGLPAGTYSVTVADTNNCKTSDVAMLLGITAPIVILTASPLMCNGDSNGSATIAVASSTGMPYTYSWSNGVTGTTGISGLTAGTYAVTVTNSYGCATSRSVVITEPPAITLTANSLTIPCVIVNGSALATAMGGTGTFTYSWSSGATGQTVSGLTPGTHSVTAIDANGCIKSTTINIVYSGGSTAVATVLSNVSCKGGSNGSASAVLSGGNLISAYSWNNGATNSSISGVIAGSYTVTITDNNGCKFTTVAVIAEPPQLTDAVSIVNAASATSCDGSITSAASGGTPPYSYQWSNSVTTAVISSLCTGLYAYTITDSQGCEFRNSVVLSDTLNGCNLHFYNMITPNGDGNNDYWHIDCITAYALNNVAIFNRWGNRIWQTDGYNNTDRAWKGTDQSGTAMPEGTYFYVVKVNSIEYSGKVELLK
ncbi:MAG: gliding motility-associated C-terminal domain-containing protein [Bacteroidetes bacterium]|nr:gliding motility-associated C-terminal domain-containing protein [Bacteroidota bacterium]